jgi:hypothetical protein
VGVCQNRTIFPPPIKQHIPLSGKRRFLLPNTKELVDLILVNLLYIPKKHANMTSMPKQKFPKLTEPLFSF